MPLTWSQWGIVGPSPSADVIVFHFAVPHTEAPAHWCDSPTAVKHKMRARYFIDDPATDGFNADAYFDAEYSNYIDTNTSGVATAWSSTWSAAAEMDEYPEGLPMPYSLWADPPKYKAGRIEALFGSNSVVCYGIEIGIVGDNGPAAADDVVEPTPRTGANIRYNAYAPLCSYLISTILIGGINKLIESARWRISGPVMGDR